jgi:hypothetical protein
MILFVPSLYCVILEYYGPQLEKLMKDMILMSAVANLSREIEESANAHVKLSEHYDPTIWQKSVMQYKLSSKPSEETSALNEDFNEFEDEVDEAIKDQESFSTNESNSRRTVESPRGSSSKLKLYRLLDSWEEPNNVEDTKVRRKKANHELVDYLNVIILR